jgi:Fur family transcriptional regulator, ferric uptake regulator
MTRPRKQPLLGPDAEPAAARAPSRDPSPDASWASVRDDLRARGLRWTPQRRVLVEVLSRTEGHVTGARLVERCREIDPETTPSTVYRTLTVLEEFGLIRHGHGADGREEFHVLPATEHGHLHCRACGGTWEIGRDEATALLESLAMNHGFAADLSHLTVVGRCDDCAGDSVQG